MQQLKNCSTKTWSKTMVGNLVGNLLSSRPTTFDQENQPSQGKTLFQCSNRLLDVPFFALDFSFFLMTKSGNQSKSVFRQFNLKILISHAAEIIVYCTYTAIVGSPSLSLSLHNNLSSSKAWSGITNTLHLTLLDGPPARPCHQSVPAQINTLTPPCLSVCECIECST